MKQQSETINAKRRVELRKDGKYLHIMKYMGSKRELLPDILEAIKKLITPRKTVLDIFAGTGSVGAYLKNDYTIYSNDIQKYSKVIADALICSNSIESFPNLVTCLRDLKGYYGKNLKKLNEILSTTIEESKSFVAIEKGFWNELKRKEYIRFFESFPSALNKFKTKNKELIKLKDMYFKNNESSNFNSFPYCQTVLLFSETYFSIQQAVEIDSLRYAVDKVFDDEIPKNIALSALIYAHSYCSSGTGHFAMFRDLKDITAVEDTFLYRKRSVWSLFKSKLNEIVNYYNFDQSFEHKTFTMDYKELLDNKKIIKNVDVIYADPPYSFVHYSRFYHATESLVKYDYDIPEFKGRYRTDRHQSPFCQKKNVEAAFDYLIEKANEFTIDIILSYSDTGMISLENIIKLLNKRSYKIKLQEIDYDHSTMGRSGHKKNQIKEYLIICKNKKHTKLLLVD